MVIVGEGGYVPIQVAVVAVTQLGVVEVVEVVDTVVVDTELVTATVVQYAATDTVD